MDIKFFVSMQEHLFWNKNELGKKWECGSIEFNGKNKY